MTAPTLDKKEFDDYYWPCKLPVSYFSSLPSPTFTGEGTALVTLRLRLPLTGAAAGRNTLYVKRL